MDINHHPMRQPTRPFIPTRPQERLADSLGTALLFGRPSLRSNGCGRVGKSTGEKQLPKLTKKWRPFDLGYLRTNAGNPERHTEAYLFRDIAMGLGLRHSKNASTHDSLERIIRAVDEEAGRANASRVILTIDNAELLVLEDYKHLCKIQNQFDGDLRLFFLFICQSDSKVTGPESLESLAPPHVYGRFFVDRHEFTGLLWVIPEHERHEQGANDVALGFRQYDEIMRWPDDKGPSFTQVFAPRAWDFGWRLEKETDPIRHEIEVLCAQEGLAMPADWLMASFEPFVYYVLVHVAGTDPNFVGLTSEHIRAGLRASAFVWLERARQGFRK